LKQELQIPNMLSKINLSVKRCLVFMVLSDNKSTFNFLRHKNGLH
jgi:hypothetical protein